MAREDINKKEEIKENKETPRNKDLKYSKKNIIIFIGIFILVIGILIAIILKIYTLFKKNTKISHDIDSGKNLKLQNKEISTNETDAKKAIPIVKKRILKRHNQELIEKLKVINKKYMIFYP